MQISRANNVHFQKNNYIPAIPHQNTKINISPSNKTFLQDIPSSAIKANFCPSFGNSGSMKNVYLTNRETGLKEKAILFKVNSDNFVNYTIGNENGILGTLSLNYQANIPENNYVIPEADNILPFVRNICSYGGKKYKGIGTSLINEAVRDSIDIGEKGYLALVAERPTHQMYYEHRFNQNPIPFFYKLGFKAVDKNIDKYINACLEVDRPDRLPDSAFLLLIPEAIENNKYYLSI